MSMPDCKFLAVMLFHAKASESVGTSRPAPKFAKSPDTGTPPYWACLIPIAYGFLQKEAKACNAHSTQVVETSPIQLRISRAWTPSKSPRMRPPQYAPHHRRVSIAVGGYNVSIASFEECFRALGMHRSSMSNGKGSGKWVSMLSQRIADDDQNFRKSPVRSQLVDLECNATSTVWADAARRITKFRVILDREGINPSNTGLLSEQPALAHAQTLRAKSGP